MFSRFLLCLLILCSREISAQDLSTPPIFNFACQIDSNCALYSKLKITIQVDSQFRKNKLERITLNQYNELGQVFETEEKFTENPALRFVTQYFYDTAGKCIYARISCIINDDSSFIVTKRVVVDDTASGHYAYELRNWSARSFVRDSVYDDLELRYIDSRANWGTTVWYPNRIYIDATSEAHGKPSVGRMYALRDSDTLYVVDMHDEGTGSYMYWNSLGFPDANTRTMTKYYKGRYVETCTWESGKLTERHEFVDSLRDRDVVLTRIYNRLDSSVLPEVVIYRYDSLTVVERDGKQPYIDYTPDSCRIDFPIPVAFPEFPTHSDYSVFRIATKLSGGITRIDFYNPYVGTALPIYSIWNNSQGVAVRLQEGDVVIRRYVR